MATTAFTVTTRIRQLVDAVLADKVVTNNETCTNGAPSATVLGGTSSTFVSDGVEVGALVTNRTTGYTATVVSIDSQVQVTTGAITGNYTAGDKFDVANVNSDLRTMLNDEQVEEFIIQNIQQQEAVYTFQRIGTASMFYRYFDLDCQGHFFEPTFTGEVGVDYEMHSNGYIKATAGAPVDTNILVTATVVSVGYVLYDIFMYLANRYAQKASFQIVNNEVVYDNVYKHLVKQAHLARGAYSA